MDERTTESFQHMEALLTEWMTRARLLEITSVVQLAKTELARRGIVLTWTVSQIDSPCQAPNHPGSRG
jgi:hypothetical protein